MCPKNDDEDTIAIMIIFDDRHHFLSMCLVSECQESFHLILLEMSSFSISVLQMKHKEVKSVLPKTTDLHKSWDSGHLTPKVIPLITTYNTCLQTSRTQGRNGEEAGELSGALTKRSHDLHLNEPVAHLGKWSP